MKKRILAFIMLFAILVSVCGCGSKQAEFSVNELKGNRFVFASGAGAWSTEVSVGENGAFKGSYHDSDMGSVGPGYPNGTRYFCDFIGQFKVLEKINEYTYKMTISDLVYTNEANTEEIIDEILYVYSDAQGLYGAEELLLYLPGAPIAELPEDYMNWVRGSAYIEEGITELPFYGLYNVTQMSGFSSYSIVESLKTRVSFTEELALEIEKSIENDPLTQIEYNEKTNQLYEMWDSDLNAIWRELKVTLDADTFNKLLTEQREWIATKEAEVKAAGAEFEDGSMQPMAMNMKAAELTKIRVYELLAYLEE